MPQVLRYEIKEQVTTLYLPANAVILSAVPDAGHINLYVLADLKKNEPAEERHFRFVRTGEPLPGFFWDSAHVLSLPGAHLFEIPARHVQPVKNPATA